MDSSWQMLEKYPRHSPEYVKKAAALVEQYHPIELDHTLTSEQKTPHIFQWFTQEKGGTENSMVHAGNGGHKKQYGSRRKWGSHKNQYGSRKEGALSAVTSGQVDYNQSFGSTLISTRIRIQYFWSLRIQT